MNSEKVKEIKEKLKKQYYYLDQAYSDHLAYGGKGDDKQEEEIYFLRDVLTLINEFESKNNELKKYKTDWLNSEKTHLQAELEETAFELASSNKILKEVNKENQQLKDQVAEIVKQFAEMLKGQMSKGEYMGKKYRLSVFRDIDIDEALKKFMKEKINNEVKE